eukprot:TRINITY_DN4006_c0_g1_i1.p1 TRINITY_DN4006_c0_g1~~TRINITY_DN4006_c0_g1_i1.p1  ORF type:complete len:580 (+),score=194.09 TRINITY_DN4006_c0_g1_i1:106-1845(+)
MIDLAAIFTTGGVLLFYRTFCTLKFDVLDSLVKKVLIQGKTSEASYFIDPYKVKWLVSSELKLIFVIAYQEIFHLAMVDELLDMMRASYVKHIIPKLEIKGGLVFAAPKFDEIFVESVLVKWENLQTKTNANKTMRSFQETDRGKEVAKSKPDEEPEKKPAKVEPTPEQPVKKVPGKYTPKPKADPAGKKSPPPKKELTTWGISENASNSAMKGLDFSRQEPVQKSNGEVPEGKYIDKEDPEMVGFLSSGEEDESEEEKDLIEGSAKKKGIFARFSSGLKNLTGNKVLTPEDLEPVLSKFKEDLMEKNVAEEIAHKLCEGIKTELLNTKTKAFTSILKTVKAAMNETLTKVLSPKRSIDILAEASRARDAGRPYVIVFIGVNGVGKSTNLAKVAYMIKNAGFSLMLAACDNFRSGAVEQLKMHGRCMEVPVFDRGYKDLPSNICAEAIREAKAKKTNVLLVDTAGRMQNNEPLMRELSRLIVVNQPDLILFIGEALVGNDAVDQLTKFNQSIVDLSPKDNIREIDGIILTKFDCVDEKVGTAITMTYTTGKPIVFVGTGQKYTHLRKLNVKTVVHALLS